MAPIAPRDVPEYIFPQVRTYVLELGFSEQEYKLLVDTVVKKTKKSLTAFAKEAIMEKLIKKYSTNKGETWPILVNTELT
jgi:hypothetical protein